MTKYKVSQAVKGELDDLREHCERWSVYGLFDGLPKNLEKWINRHQEFDYPKVQKKEQAVIDYVFNDANNFEVKKPTWGIVSKKASKDGYYISLTKANFVDNLKAWSWGFYDSQSKSLDGATRITDPKLKDALLYANKDFEAIEVEE